MNQSIFGSLRSNKNAKSILAVAVAFFALSTNAAVSSTSTTSLSTETASLKEITETPQVKRWSGSFETENYKGMNSANGSYNGDIEAWEAVKVNYKISDTNSLTFAQEWSRRYGYNNNESNETLQDSSLRYTISGFKLPSDIGYTLQSRAYLPVSTASRNNGTITQIRFYNIFKKQISPSLEVGLLINPRFYVRDESTSGDEGVPRFRILNTVSVKYSINDKVSLNQSLGIYSKWKNEVARADNIDAWSYVEYSPTNWLDLSAGIRQSDDASNIRLSGARLYEPSQSEYFVIAGFNI